MKVERNFEGVAIDPSLANLSLVLRHKELWPEGFEWDYSGCESCAMGLASTLWDATVGFPCSINMTRTFDVSLSWCQQVFGGDLLERMYGVKYYCDVTPEMVADKIDEYLEVK